MKVIIGYIAAVTLFISTVVLAAPLDDPKQAQILRYENDNIGIDGYKFA